MHQIDNPWAITAKPMASPVGRPGWFQKGAPPNLLATIVDFDWANTIQAEILNVVLGAGLTPDKQNDSQLLLAIQTMIEGVTGVDLSLFVLRAGDTMTGGLTTPWLTANTGRIVSQAAVNPSVVVYDTTADLAAGMWVGPDDLGIYFGSTYGDGTPLAPWSYADGSGLWSAAGIVAVSSITSQNGRIIAQGGSYPSVTVYNTNGFAFGMWADPNGNLGFGSADGSGTPAGQLMTLSPAGGVYAASVSSSGGISGAEIAASGTINAAQIMSSGTIYVSYPLAPAFYLTGDGSTNTLNFQGGYAFQWRVSDGMLIYLANNAVAMTMDYTGAMSLANNLSVYESVTFTGSGPGSPTGVPGAIWCTPNTGAFRFMGIYPQFQQLGIGAWGGSLAYNTQSHPDGGGAWECDINGTTQQTGYAYNLANPNPSDVSLKSNIQPWSPGLAEVLQINTVSFEYTPEAKLGLPGSRHYGVNAQEVQAVLPEAVLTMQRHLSNDPADPPTEVLAVNANAIFYACVNAIKEIAGRLDVLEARAA